MFPKEKEQKKTFIKEKKFPSTNSGIILYILD